MARSHVTVLLLAAAILCSLRRSHSAKQTVGDSYGWAYPPNPTFYQDWANKKTLVVEDRLVFHYRSSMYALMEVSKEDFPNCTRNNVVQMFAHSPVVVHLTEEGARYFYCNVGLHCEAGMKVSVTVHQTAPALPPAPAPAVAAV